MTERPNILLIMCDSLPPHFTGAHGDPVGATPNLDRLADRGIVFENAYCSYPLCAPSRASLLTGRYASQIGCFDNGSPFAPEWPTLGHALGAAGYDTAIIGKMHFVGHDQHHGFARRIALETDYAKGYDPRLFKLAYDWDRPSGGNPDGTKMMGASYVASERWDDYRLHFERDERIHQQAIAYLSQDRTDPFFACVSYHAPHNPFWIPAADRDRFRQAELPLPRVPAGVATVHGPMDAWLDDFHYAPEFRERMMQPANLRWLYETFYGMIHDLDRRVGALLDALQRQGHDDTVVVFISDHGDMMGHRGMLQKRYFYENSVRVPLIVSMPEGGPSGLRHRPPVSLLDLFPTLAGLAQAPCPGDLPGRDLLAGIEGGEHGAAAEDRTVFAEYHGEGVHAPCFMVRRGGFKYLYVHGHEERLYDLVTDPDEYTNLLAGDDGRDEAHLRVATELRGSLLRQFDPDATARAARASQRSRRFVYEAETRRAEARSDA